MSIQIGVLLYKKIINKVRISCSILTNLDMKLSRTHGPHRDEHERNVLMKKPFLP